MISRHEYAGGGYASILSGKDIANQVKIQIQEAGVKAENADSTFRKTMDRLSQGLPAVKRHRNNNNYTTNLNRNNLSPIKMDPRK